MIKKEIKIPIYEGSIIFCFVDKYAEINRALKFPIGFELEVMDIEDPEQHFSAFVFEHPGNGKVVVAMTKASKLEHLIHECVHVMSLVFKNRGIKGDWNNDEPMAYFIEWVFKELYSFWLDSRLKNNESYPLISSHDIEQMMLKPYIKRDTLTHPIQPIK